MGVVRRWTGNGVANGTAVTAANVNTAGNGDTVTRTATVEATMVYQGNGFAVSGGTAATGRLELPLTPGKAAAAQVRITIGSTPQSAGERIISFRGASTASGYVRRGTDGRFSLARPDHVVIIPSQSPAWVVGHTYQIDVVVALASSPSATNGRMFYRIKSLTDANWNTTGEFFYDTGYTQDAGVANLESIRVGKDANGILSQPDLFESLAWNEVTVNPADTSQSAAVAYFITETPSGPAPTVNAGADISVESGAPFTLQATVSGGTGGVVSRVWTRPGAPTTNGATRSETAPILLNDQAYTYTMTVTDGVGNVVTDSVTVTVRKSLLVWWDPARGDVPLVIDLIEPGDPF